MLVPLQLFLVPKNKSLRALRRKALRVQRVFYLFRKIAMCSAVPCVLYLQYSSIVEQTYLFAEVFSVGNLVVHKPIAERLDSRPSRGITQADLVRIHSFGGEKVQVRLVQQDKGFSLHATLGFQPKESLFLIAEHARHMRVFKSVDSALRTCSRMGFKVVIVEMKPDNETPTS